MTERTCSIKAGLLASTVTPGSTAPEGSRTTPVRLLCAHAVTGTIRRPKRTRDNIRMRIIGWILRVRPSLLVVLEWKEFVPPRGYKPLTPIGQRGFSTPLHGGQEE